MNRSHNTELPPATQGEGDPYSVVVLRYHAAGQSHGMTAAGNDARIVGAFRKQLELFERWGFTTITLPDYRLFLEGHLHLPRRPMILTFDGIESLVPLYPVLSEVGGRAMVYVGTDSLQGPEGGRLVPLLRAMAGAGVGIGSLTCSRRDLRALGHGERMEELARSREILEDLVGDIVDSCAYPFDAVDNEVKRSVRDAGYAFGLSGPGGARLFGSDPLEVRREDIGVDTGPLALAMRAFAPGDRLRRLKKRSLSIITRETALFSSGPYA